MAEIKTFETKEQKIDRKLDELHEQINETIQEGEAEVARFLMKGDNGATLTTEDVKNLFKPFIKAHDMNGEAAELLNEKGIETRHRDLGDLAIEAFWEEKVEGHKINGRN